MAEKKNKKTDDKVVGKIEKKNSIVRPQTTPEAREKQLVRLAVDLAEKQLRDGTASSAVMTHYLKIASRRETLEREILEKQSAFLEAKASTISKDQESHKLAKEAIEAMKNYNSSSN